MAILNERTRRDLEFDQVLVLVQAHAASTLGQAAVARLKPLPERAGIEAEFRRVRDCTRAIVDEAFYVGALPDIDRALAQAAEATTIDPEDFWRVLHALEVIHTLKARIDALEGETSLKVLGRALEKQPELEGFIRRSVNEKGDIRDDASPLLRQLCRRRQVAETRARKKLGALLNSASAGALLQEAVITRRGGRLVVPVKSHLRHQLDGIVQDSSNSGQTLFLEPASVVAENNLMRELGGEIRDEKLRVLQALTDKLRREAPLVRRSLEAYARIDCVYARAQYALRQRACVPELNDEGLIKLHNARHPLLDAQTVVPLSLSLGTQHRGMVITGPNTGGKTITLKTVGLLSLMAQSSIPVPADEGSQLSLFARVRSDIGDEQSIAQNLSTFSSHLRNIVGILDDLDQNPETLDERHLPTLVLLDEIGAGTDPQEGTALGVALLQTLLAKDVRLLVSTHYSALKRFAYSHPRLKNASVEFDLETLAPTYRLLQGVPGSSNAFLIAQRLGLPTELIDAAERTLSEGEVRTEDIIRQLQAEQRALDQEREAFREAKQGLEVQVRRYQDKLAQLETEQRRALGSEFNHADAELKQARKTLESALHEARQTQDEGSLKQQLERVTRTAKTLKHTQQTFEQPAQAASTLDALKIGQWVRVKGFKKPGRVTKIVSDARVQIEIESVRLWTKLEDLASAHAATESAGKRSRSIPSFSVTAHASPPAELNVRGMTVVETLRLVDQYLNQLLLADREHGFILHGKGTGALRRAIRDHLRTLPWVKAVNAAPPAQGGEGVTLVQLG